MNKNKMKQLKGFFLIVILLLKFGLSAQEVNFSKELLSKNDKDIQEIIELWENNINDNIKGFVLKDKSIVAKHWNNDEVKRGWIDIAKDNISSTVPIYLYGETITFEILKKSNDLFEIRSLILQTDSTSKNVLAIFKTCALRTDEGFKLSNSFYQNKKNLNSYSTKHLDFYFDSAYEFSNSIAIEANEFYQKLTSTYGINPINRITYIVGSDLNIANKLLGFEFSIRNGDSPFAAYFLSNQGIIVSSIINHRHEITHSIFETAFPYVHRIFQEGIATYYGGSSGNEYAYHKEKLKEFVSKNPVIELSKIWSLEFNDNVRKTNYFYSLGAVFIEMALEKGGEKKVFELFNHSSNDLKTVLNEVLEISEENFNDKIKQHLTK
jgi:hypothetical protein